MKSLKVWLLITCVTAVLSFSLIPSAATADDLRYGRWDEFCPYNCDFDKRGYHGSITDVFMAVAKNNGIEFKPVFVPENRKYRALDSDVSNVVTVWSSSDAMDKVVASDEAIAAVRKGTVALKGNNIVFKELSDLDNLRIGINANLDDHSSYANYMSADENKHRVVAITGKNKYDRLFKLLATDRIDLVILTFETALFQSQIHAGAETYSVNIAPFLETTYLYPAFSKNNPDAQKYADMMTSGIRELRQNGELQTILNQYEIPDWIVSTVAAE